MTKRVHERRWFSMVAWRCTCGALWDNERLKGKTDIELEAELNFEWKKHLASMEEQGA